MLKAASGGSPALSRIGAWTALAAVEFLATRLYAPLQDVWSIWPAIGIANAGIKILVLSLGIFVLISWPRRSEIWAELNVATDEAHTIAMAALSASAVLVALVIRNHLAESLSTSSALASPAYAVAVLVAAVSLLLVAAPLSFWRTIARTCRLELLLALGFGCFGLVAGELLNRERGSFFSQENWAEVSDATMYLSFWIARIFDSGVYLDPGARIMGTGNFSVQVFAECSGYEGMFLISAFIVGYAILFRKYLRFPNVLLLFPLAMAMIWILNSFRIALLMIIGAHVSPAIAVGGFHSQFGWICFLFIAIAIMTSAQRLAFFGKPQQPIFVSAPRKSVAEANRSNPAVIFLAPFIALMAAQILTRAAAPLDFLLYPLKVIAVVAVLYAWRRSYRTIWSWPAMSSVLLGALAAVAWIATDPAAETVTPLAASLSELPPAVLAVWLIIRGVGTIVTVPIAEELAFRGYLYRTVISARFENVDFKRFHIAALIISSFLFGLMHDRWLAATIAGALYALIMLRRGKISDAIAAHMTTNAVIFAWAVANGQWSLL